jgi:hypothetical protein
VKPIRSDALRDSAGHLDAECTLRIAGVCRGRAAGNVLCHVRIGCAGVGTKPDDVCAAFGCCACHDVFDGRAGNLVKGSPDWLFYALRGITETTAWWIRHGFLKIEKGE